MVGLWLELLKGANHLLRTPGCHQGLIPSSLAKRRDYLQERAPCLIRRRSSVHSEDRDEDSHEACGDHPREELVLRSGNCVVLCFGNCPCGGLLLGRGYGFVFRDRKVLRHKAALRRGSVRSVMGAAARRQEAYLGGAETPGQTKNSLPCQDKGCVGM